MEAKRAIASAERGDVDFFKTVAPEILLNARDEDDDTALTVAALEGHLDCCEVIVERCTPLLYHQSNYFRDSILHYVVEYGERDNNVENIMRFLITADSQLDLELGGGGNIPNKRLLTMQNIIGMTALHLAVQKGNHEATKLLLEANRDFELLRMVDSDQQTALHIAVEQGNLGVVKLMCEAGLDKQLLSMPDSKGNTPLRLALRDRKVEIVRLLTEAKLRLQDAIPCAKRGDVDFFKTVPPKILLRARDAADINTVLTVAAREGHLDCCKVIVERCTPLLYHQDKYKWSVLHCVIAYDEDNNVENIMSFLITADSKPDLELGGGAKIPNHRLLTMRNKYGATALHKAVEKRNHVAIKLLLEADRDFELLRMVDDYGRTCLHIAVEKGDHVLAKLIITKARLDNEFLSMPDSQGNTPLDLAVGNNNLDMARLLMEGDMV